MDDDLIYNSKHKLRPSYKKQKFSLSSTNFNKNKIFLISSIIIIIAVVVFLLFFMKSKSSAPGLKMVSGTEYISGEEGQVIVRLQDNKDVPIINADCNLSLLYPDKSFFLIDVPMAHTSILGNYYHPFITPQTEGVYEEHIMCSIPTANGEKRILNVSSAFHVSAGLNEIVKVSRSQREQYVNLINRMNSLDANIAQMQAYIDSNVMGNINYLGGKINDINQSVNDLNMTINDSMNGIEGRLNDTMLTNFSELYNKFKSAYSAMSGAFDYNK